jgi:IS605 OrfB family transposase
MWFGVYRWSFNEAKHINEEYHRKRHKRRKKKVRKYLSFMTLRNRMRKNGLPKKWNSKLIPDRIVVGAIKDYCSNFKTCFSLLRKKKIKFFHLKDKHKKGLTQTLNLEKCCFSKKDNTLFPNPKNPKDIRDKKIKKGLNIYGVYKSGKKIEKLKNTEINHGCRLSYENERFYLLVPYDEKEQKSEPKFSVISIDSGVRTFQTGYCPEGHSLEICKGVDKKLKGLHEKIDSLNTKYFETRVKKERRIFSLKRKRWFSKINNKVRDLHWKTIKLLTNNYKNIVISDFKTKGLMTKKYLTKSTKRAMNVLAHYKFRQRLREKCDARGNILFVTDEAFTSKTCGRCGRINQSLGSSKDFICPFCGFEIDRDINAGRNILLKFLTSATEVDVKASKIG